jgi:DNA helicase HerA-like ATPase
VRLLRVDRAAFVRDYWDYNPGEHVTLIEPTQGGKTFLAGQLLEDLRGEIPATMLVMKPRDKTPAEVTRRLGYKEIPTWPPPPRWPLPRLRARRSDRVRR